MSIADNILSFGRENEGWPRNCDMEAISNDRQKGEAIAPKHISK